MEQWKIQRDRAKCVEAGCPLPTADSWFAVLELPSCVRRDLCANCYHKYERTTDIEPIFWKCRRRSKTSNEPVLDVTALRLLFDRLAELDDDRARGLRYFVTLLLLRKRVLKMVDAMTPEQEQADFVVIDPKVPGMAPVALFAPDLDTDRLANLEAELLAALGDAAADEADGGESAAGSGD